MIEAHDHWVLPIAGWKVTRCEVGHAFGLQLWGPNDIYTLGINCSFTYRGGDGRAWVLGPDVARPAWAPALAVFGLTVERATAHKGGGLDLAFSDGSALSVAPDPNFEAWELHGSQGILMVSLPGGELATWSER